MNRNFFVSIGILLIIGMTAFLWWGSQRIIDKTAEIDHLIDPVFHKSDLTRISPTAQSRAQKVQNGKKYIHIDRMFEAPAKFNWKFFDTSLKSALKNTDFRVSRSDFKSMQTRETYYADIVFGKLLIMTLRVDLKRAPPKEIAAKPQPPTTKKHPRIAIVIDDFGYTTANLETLFSIDEPVTFSILPNLQHSREIAQLARSRGYEVMLHLPLEPYSNKVTLEPDTIRSGMSRGEVLKQLAKNIAAVPGLSGANNHMGSKATDDKALMTGILSFLKSRNLYFLDSLTSMHSICAETAKETGERFAQRDIFLDNSGETDYIINQLAKLEKLALRRGYAIGICHDRKNSIHVLSRMMPEMVRDGIEFVSLSELVQ